MLELKHMMLIRGVQSTWKKVQNEVSVYAHSEAAIRVFKGGGCFKDSKEDASFILPTLSKGFF